MLNWLIYIVPWWLWAIPSAVVVGSLFFYLSRTVGVRNAIAAAAVMGAAAVVKISQHRGRQQGHADRIRQEKEDAQDAIDRATRARRAAESAPVERLRDDDGYKRR